MIHAASLIRSEIAQHKAELDELTTVLVEQGLGIWSDGIGGDDAALILRGQANLLDDIQAAEGLTEIRGLFDALEARENALRLLDATRDGDGVKIFIGAENNLFGRICLHATALEFLHPFDDEPVRFESEYDVAWNHGLKNP